MRRDVYIENDSGGFSVLAAAAADAIIDDQRERDTDFVASFQVLLLELYGDDSLPVRVVVDEPLTPDEDAQWLAHASWRIDTPDGRILVMGGFDPDVLGWWRDAGTPDEDGRGVGVVTATPGSWRVDVYAHAGSMNGRAILSEHHEPLGAFFRRSHPERPFPLWLADRLDFSGEEDPGHEDVWRDVATSVEDGRLLLATEPTSFVGLLVHLTPFEGDPPEAPESGWFDWDAGRRVPEVFPLGIAAEVADPAGESFLDRALRRERPSVPMPPASELVEIIESWPGDPLTALDGPAVTLAPTEAYFLYWIVGMLNDSPPAFELWVSDAPGWSPPEPTSMFAVASRTAATVAMAAPPGSGGWAHWWGMRDAAAALAGVPDGATLDLATLRFPHPADDEDEVDPAVGRTLFSGKVESNQWHVGEISPAVPHATLADAVAFVRELVVDERISVRGDAERAVFDENAQIFSPEDDSLMWEGEQVQLAEPDERTLLLLAEPVFRTRFGKAWPSDPIDI